MQERKSQKVKIRKGYDPVPRVVFNCTGVPRTKQAMKAECDINNIMRKFEKSGIVDHLSKYDGRYGQFIGAPEYHEAMNQVAEAAEMFMEIPAKIRKRFNNDPAEFLEFVQNEDNRDELVSMGLARAPTPAPEPEKEQEVGSGVTPSDTPSEGV